MIKNADISALYKEFTDALVEVLAENSAGPTRRGRLARARASVKKHSEYSEHDYFLAVEPHSHVGKVYKTQVDRRTIIALRLTWRDDAVLASLCGHHPPSPRRDLRSGAQETGEAEKALSENIGAMERLTIPILSKWKCSRS